MLQRFHAMRERSEGGFTLIELLVVILIIAILAAIAIPVFLNQREKAYVADVQSTLKNWATATESAATQTSGAYNAAAITVANVRTTEGAKNPTTQTVTYQGNTAGTYCIRVVETRLGANTAAHPWQTATYFSTDGAPSFDDICT